MAIHDMRVLKQSLASLQREKLLTSKLDKLINGDAGLGIVRTELKQYFIVSLQDIARLEIYLNVTDVDEEIRQLFQAIGSQLRERSKSYGFAGVADACGEFLKAVKKSVNIAEKLKTVKKEFLVLWERVLPALGRTKFLREMVNMAQVEMRITYDVATEFKLEGVEGNPTPPPAPPPAPAPAPAPSLRPTASGSGSVLEKIPSCAIL